MNYLHLEKLAAHLASTGILCLRFTCRTRNFQYRKECFTAAVVSCNEIRSMFLPFVFILGIRRGNVTSYSTRTLFTAAVTCKSRLLGDYIEK